MISYCQERPNWCFQVFVVFTVFTPSDILGSNFPFDSDTDLFGELKDYSDLLRI